MFNEEKVIDFCYDLEQRGVFNEAEYKRLSEVFAKVNENYYSNNKTITTDDFLNAIYNAIIFYVNVMEYFKDKKDEEGFNDACFELTTKFGPR